MKQYSFLIEDTKRNWGCTTTLSTGDWNAKVEEIEFWGLKKGSNQKNTYTDVLEIHESTWRETLELFLTDFASAPFDDEKQRDFPTLFTDFFKLYFPHLTVKDITKEKQKEQGYSLNR